MLLRVRVPLGVVVPHLAQTTVTTPDGLLVLGFGSVWLLSVLASNRLLPSGSVRFIHAKIQMAIAFRKVPPNQRISLQLESIPIPFPCLNISRSHRPSPLLLQPLRQRTNVLI